MHSKYLKCSILLLLTLILPSIVKAADTPVKREMRSSWVATVWRLDWPPSVITTTGDETQINRQKKAMTTLLDSLAINNFNAINFQVRSRCDAMYRSSYEPWSTDLVATRGMDPGWDPLEWVVAECHKRGLECHAWLNPYRYESSISATPWDGPNDYRNTHPEWLMEHNNSSILNPGLPEVRQRICDVIKEILNNYDVDGVLFDDYFYIGGTPNSADADLYNAYKDAGGTLSQADWRRENVNMMIADVYQTIQETKPWVRFGVAPAGIAATQATVSNKYGMRPCPSGSDWQYTSIFSDPLAWISQQNLDFISPQVYWTIGASTDYAKVTPWWGEVADKFGRHLYVSHSISTLNLNSKAPGMSGQEYMKANDNFDMASGPNNETFEEYSNQVRLNRSSSLDGNPGSIFYSTKYLYSLAPKFAHHLKKTVFNTPAIIPTMTWKPGENPGVVTDVTRSGNKLSWTGHDNVRYTVYAIPADVPAENFQGEAEYLLGTSYGTEFTIPDNRLSGYNYAVCVLDRYGYEYSPAFAGRPTQSLSAPVITFPDAGAAIEFPFDFQWDAVDKATSYIVEVATDPTFNRSSLLYTLPCDGTECSTTRMPSLDTDKTYYWRVRSCGISATDGISESRGFSMTRMLITSLTDGATDVSLTPLIEWSIADRKVNVEMSTKETFATLAFSEEAQGGSWQTPEGHLAGLTTYYCRLSYEKNGEAMTSPVVMFTTKEEVPGPLSISYPVDGGDFYADDYIRAGIVAGYYQITFQLDQKENIGNRFIQETSQVPNWHSRNAAGEMGKTLEKNKLYYMRVRGNYRTADGNKYSEWSPVVAAYYRGVNSGVEEIEIDPDDTTSQWFNLQGIRIDRPASGQIVIRRKGSQADKVLIK